MGDNFSTVGDTFSTVGDTFSTVEVVQYNGDNISTVGDSFSTVEGIQYIGGLHQYMQKDNISTVKGIQYSGGRILISACLVINNDEKLSTFFVLRYEIFIRKFFEIQADSMLSET